MTIQIIDTRSEFYPNTSTTYQTTEMACGKHAIAVMKVTPGDGRPATWNVNVSSNAAARVWRSMGRTFATPADAVAHYKTPEIRAMIEHAAGL